MSIKKIEIMRLVKAKCLDCCGFDKVEVKLCTVVGCPLFSIRNGSKGVESDDNGPKKRNRKPMSDEHKAALKAGRDAKNLTKG